MTVEEIITSIDELSQEDQAYLFEILRQRKAEEQGDKFWESLQECRRIIEEENIVFTDEDFAGLRDKSVGREVNL